MSAPGSPPGPDTEPAAHIERLTAAERDRFVAEHPRSRELFERARTVMPGGVPMSWMVKWPGPFPVFVAEASGAHFTDVDGHDYVDLCLGDTGAMTGHSPAADGRDGARAGRARDHRDAADRGLGAGRRGAGRRFGLPLWQFTLSATDANRHAIRYARHVTGRREGRRARLLLPRQRRRDLRDAGPAGSGRTVPRRGNIGPPVRPGRDDHASWSSTTWPASSAALARGDVAAVLCEPALTNVGIVLPDDGYHDGAARADQASRRTAHHRRDAHPLGRTRRLHPGARPRPGPDDDGQGDRRRHPGAAPSG